MEWYYVLPWIFAYFYWTIHGRKIYIKIYHAITNRYPKWWYRSKIKGQVKIDQVVIDEFNQWLKKEKQRR